MNNKTQTIFQKFKVELVHGNGPTLNLKELSIQIQNGTEDTVVFYRITDNENAWKNFYSRLGSTSSKLIILNKRPSDTENLTFRGSIYLCDDKNWLSFQSALCDHFYELPANKKFIGITGTNGKTTTVNLIRDLLWANDQKACSVGTIGLQGKDGAVIEDLSITTPSYIDIRRILFKYQANFDYFVFEVSSHALDQDRFFGLHFIAGAWTNLTQDHLDYHKTLGAYAGAKARLAAMSDHFFILEGHDIVKNALENVGAKFKVLKTGEADSEAPPFFKLHHNWENMKLALACVQVCLKENLKYSWDDLKPPRGRFETIEWGNKLIVVDYAHTPDAIAQILSSTKKSFAGRELICLFGAGGDRDPTKRPIMGQTAARYADSVVVTSDNPRSEDPALIIEQIVEGIESPEKILRQMPDRRKAIEETLASMKSGAILVIAGKGHETYQEIKGVKHPFDDKKVVLNFISKS